MPIRAWSLAVLALLLCQAPARAQNMCASQQLSSHSVSPPCTAKPKICAAWHAFRASFPFPYQTIAVSPYPDGSAIVVLSEPPPVGSREEIKALVEAVFDGHTSQLHNLRLPVGYDGWLEDVVFRVSGFTEPKVEIATASGGRVAISHDLANRLEYLSDVLFGDAGTFYVDELGVERPATALPQIALDPIDVEEIVSRTGVRWSNVRDVTEEPRSWKEVASSAEPSVYADQDALVVALVIPKGTDVHNIQRVFRWFAIGTDYLVGAIRLKKGGLALVGRNRVLPLNVLPPLRFETLRAFGESAGHPLAQSYERQRLFAGKVKVGDFTGWDWAPVYLSPELQDSEFGTLLNLADQQLKSWSEHGNVRYATFGYQLPSQYPFGNLPASQWFKERALTSSLIFNWNTAAYATAVDLPVGRVITASSTTSLPVSYILPLEFEPDVIQGIREQLQINPQDHAQEGSVLGTMYFAMQGDPVLARVARNVFLYQSVGEARPFSSPRPPKARSASAASFNTARAEAVNTILRQAAERSLREAQEASDLSKLISASAVAVPKLAQILATPNVHTAALIKTHASFTKQLEAAERTTPDIFMAVLELQREAETAESDFRSGCIVRGGTVRTTLSGLECSWQAASHEAAHIPQNEAGVARAKARIKRLETEQELAYRQLAEIGSAQTALLRERRAADEVANALRSSAAISNRIADVLGEVLAATRNVPSTGFIQTPSVVLSCNAVETMYEGGHNIDALPWLAKAQRGAIRSTINNTSDRPTIVVPLGEANRSTSVARSLRDHVDTAEPSAPRKPSTALGLDSITAKDSFLARLRRTPPSPTAQADVMRLAADCACDVYVQRGEGGLVTIVETAPPPHSRTVFGVSALVDALGKAGRPPKVTFSGFNPRQVSAISYGTSRRLMVNTRSTTGWLRRARSLFGKSNSRAETVMTTKVRNTLASVTSDRGIALRQMIEHQPAWREVTMVAETAAQPEYLIRVRFADSTPVVEHMTVKTFDAAGDLVISPELSNAAQRVVQQLSGTQTSVDGAIRRLTDKLGKDPGVHEVEFFLKDVDLTVRLRRTNAGSEIAWVL